MVHLIVGYGEVGKALHKVLGNAEWMDRKGGTHNGDFMDVIHVCIPYSKEFDKIVNQLKPHGSLVIVHSSVPVGTCDALGVVHSFITGKHPDLEGGMRTFTKYFGGKQAKKTSKIL